MIKKWEAVSSKDGGDFKIFKAQWLKRRHPDWNKEGDFVVLNSLPWVNIIPLTHDNKVLLIEQYRHGTDNITIEVPGGLVELNEDPGSAGERECLEETGYAGQGKAEYLGETLPNPAFLNNICYSFLWKNCTKIKEQSLDKHEDIRVIEVPIAEIKEYIISGKINHSLVLDAFFFYFLKFGL